MEFEDIQCSAPLDSFTFSADGKPNLKRATEFLSAFATDNNLGYNLYKTRAHVGIYDILLDHAHSLSENKYKDRKGECSATLVGAKGIGKTSSLQVFVKLCPYIVPDVYTVYVNYNNILSSGPEFHNSLITIAIQSLRKQGVQVPIVAENIVNAKDNLLGFLVKSGLKLLILVDELDQLYKSIDEVSLRTLHDLAALGNQPTGKVSVIVCGSSAMMEALITCNADDSVRREFPLLNKAPNLNGTKYLTKRVYTTLPTDLDAVASMTGVPNDATNKGWLRFVAFAGGCSARATGRILSDSSMSGALLVGLSPDSALTGHNTLGVGDISFLRAAILSAMFEKNSALVEELIDSKNCTIILDKLATVPWEERFLPLTYEEVVQSWKGLLKRGDVAQDHSDQLLYNLYHLSDRCWLTLSGVSNSAPQYIYPYSMLHLLKPSISSEMLLPMQDKLMEMIKQGGMGVGSYLANPRVAGVAVPALVVGGCCCCCASAAGCSVM